MGVALDLLSVHGPDVLGPLVVWEAERPVVDGVLDLVIIEPHHHLPTLLGGE